MKITVLHVGDVPAALRDEFGPYISMFERMFARIGAGFTFEVIQIAQGAKFPELDRVEALLIPGAAAGVYDDLGWIDPLCNFIRRAYTARTPMLGVCFGHQVMAHALGGDVRKSEKGWGLGRHTYRVAPRSDAFTIFGETASIAASHQDQVISPPDCAQVYLKSDFTPNAGLVYDNGAALSMQPHPEFAVAYSKALCDLRLSETFDQQNVDAAKASLDQPLDDDKAALFLARFVKSNR